MAKVKYAGSLFQKAVQVFYDYLWTMELYSYRGQKYFSAKVALVHNLLSK